MTEHKHTPGPWDVLDDECDPCALKISSEEHGEIALLHDPLAEECARLDALHANAYLMAAAPELLAACGGLLQWVDALIETARRTAKETGDSAMRDWLEDAQPPHMGRETARVAIAKATGGE
jgi:hypothetical protein